MWLSALVDFSEKDIAIQVGQFPVKIGQDQGKYEGIIFSPERINAKDNPFANELHSEFGFTNTALSVDKLLRTEQGPGEMKDTLSRLIGQDIESSMYVGGYIRPLLLTSIQLEALQKILESSDSEVLAQLAMSREKKML